MCAQRPNPPPGENDGEAAAAKREQYALNQELTDDAYASSPSAFRWPSLADEHCCARQQPAYVGAAISSTKPTAPTTALDRCGSHRWPVRWTHGQSESWKIFGCLDANQLSTTFNWASACWGRNVWLQPGHRVSRRLVRLGDPTPSSSTPKRNSGGIRRSLCTALGLERFSEPRIAGSCRRRCAKARS